MRWNLGLTLLASAALFAVACNTSSAGGGAQPDSGGDVSSGDVGDVSVPDGVGRSDASPETASEDPSQPPPGFFDPPSDHWGTLTFKGVINTEAARLGNTSTLGLGQALMNAGGAETLLSDELAASLTVFPGDHPVEEMRGKTYIRIDGDEEVETRGNGRTYVAVVAALPVEALVAMKTSGTGEAPLPPFSVFRVLDVDYTIRQDGVTFTRYCERTHADDTATSSRIFVNHSSATDFAAGEDLIVWMNVALTPETVASPETEATLCSHYSDGAAIDAAAYAKGVVEDGTDLGCPLPEGYDVPPDGDSITLSFVGPINHLSSRNPTLVPGLASASATIGGEPRSVTGYSATAERYIYEPSSVDSIIIETNGSYEQLGTGGDHRVLRAVTGLSRKAALALGDDETVISNPVKEWETASDLLFLTTIYEETSKDRDVVSYLRRCVVAVTDLDKESTLYVCHEPGMQFALGDVLRVATRLSLTTDPATLASSTGIGADCRCVQDGVKVFPCADFDAL